MDECVFTVSEADSWVSLRSLRGAAAVVARRMNEERTIQVFQAVFLAGLVGCTLAELRRAGLRMTVTHPGPAPMPGDGGSAPQSAEENDAAGGKRAVAQVAPPGGEPTGLAESAEAASKRPRSARRAAVGAEGRVSAAQVMTARRAEPPCVSVLSDQHSAAATARCQAARRPGTPGAVPMWPAYVPAQCMSGCVSR